MKSKFVIMLAVGIGFSMASRPLFAHHGGAAYDTEKKITLRGTVVSWFWANPHCVLQLDVTDEAGQAVHWNIESENPSTLIKLCWNRQSLKAGDQITITVVPVRNGKPIGRMWEAVLADGQKLDAPHGFAGGIPGGTQRPEDSPKQ